MVQEVIIVAAGLLSQFIFAARLSLLAAGRWMPAQSRAYSLLFPIVAANGHHDQKV